MACYKPIQAWQDKRGVFFGSATGRYGIPIQLPCGRCIGCRLARSREWAVRCMHESAMHSHNCFLTLTYNDDHLPKNKNLNKLHFQKFIRSLRKRTGREIRYYMCGEYGEETSRPHYHAILFGYHFPDATLWSIRRGNRVYRSALLERIWTYGHSEIGSVTFQSAAYVARYIIKKQNNQQKVRKLDLETGEITDTRIHEYTQMSLKPGIGKSYYEKYTSDFQHDECIIPDGKGGSKTMPVPTYYRKIQKIQNPEQFEKHRLIRIEKAENNPNNEEQRLKTREYIQQSKLDRLKRTHE